MEDNNDAALSAEVSILDSYEPETHPQDPMAAAAEPEDEREEPEVQEAPEGDEDHASDPEPDADTEAPEFLHGNARTRLRDGSEVTIGELKKAYDEAKEYRVRQAEFDARRQEFEAKQAQIAQQEQFFSQTIQQAKAVLQANFPQKPDYTAVQRGELDIITYQEQVAAYNHAAEKWQALTRAEQAKAQEAQARQQEAIQQRIVRETELLKEAIPELKTDEGFKAFKSELLTHAPKEYGFSAEELANLADHRALRVLKDAIAYRKLQAEKAKVAAKVKDVPPVQVQAPGRRVTASEREAQSRGELLKTVRQTGDRKAAEAFLSSFD